jgi:hypothetical protein
MKKWTRLSLLLATSLLLSATAQAQDDEPLPDISGSCAPEVTENRGGRIDIEGLNARWFHPDVARCMVVRLGNLPRYSERVRLLEQRLTIADERHALMVRQVQLAEEGEQAAVGALEAGQRRAREAEEEANLERTLRWLWFGIGVVVVVAVEVLAVWIFSEVSDTI